MGEGANLDALAVQVQEHERRLGEHDNEHGWAREHIEALTRDISDTERRLRDSQEAGFREVRGVIDQSNRDLRDHLNTRLDRMDQHLTDQDAKLDNRRSQWLYILGSAGATAIVLIIVAAITHVWGL